MYGSDNGCDGVVLYLALNPENFKTMLLSLVTEGTSPALYGTQLVAAIVFQRSVLGPFTDFLVMWSSGVLGHMMKVEVAQRIYNFRLKIECPKHFHTIHFVLVLLLVTQCSASYPVALILYHGSHPHNSSCYAPLPMTHRIITR